MDGDEPAILEEEFEGCKSEFLAIQSQMTVLLSEGRAPTTGGRIDQMRRALQLMKRWAGAGERLAAILGVNRGSAN
jgi:hypothetical protein